MSLVLGAGLWFTANRPKFEGFAETYTVYRGAYSSFAQKSIADGVSYYFSFDKTGESCEIYGAADKDEIFKSMGAREVFSERVKEGVSFYGYTEKIPYFIRLNGNKINLHVFASESRTVVGTLLIYGSF